MQRSRIVTSVKKYVLTGQGHFGARVKNFTGEVFWVRGYFVSTIWLAEGIVRAYIRDQEHEDERYDQMKLDV